jgi:hypothetical protein
MSTEHDRPIERHLQVTISEDKLRAYLEWSSLPEHFSCTIEELLRLLGKRQIVYGIDYAKLSAFAADPPAAGGSPLMVAAGQAPVDGKPGSIEYLFGNPERQLKPAEREDGKVDFKEVLHLNNVKKGQLLARKIPPTSGKEGRAVTGELLVARDGREALFKIGKNVVQGPERDTLYAAIDGMVVLSERGKINVFPVYEVNGDVDYGTGNIDFVGSVVIRGNVRSGFRVRAEGDIRVTGGVEAAELVAGGSVEIAAGILGQGKGRVKAGRNVKSSFIQEGFVEAGEDVLVSQSIMHSTVRAGQSIMCQGFKGLVVGGILQAGEKISARTVGNAVSTATVLEVGALPEVRNELNGLREELKNLREQLAKTGKALGLLDQLAAAGQLAPEKMAMRIKLNHTHKQGTERVLEIRERIYELEQLLEGADRAVVSIAATIYGGTKIVIGRYSRILKDPAMRVHFRLEGGEIAMIANTI